MQTIRVIAPCSSFDPEVFTENVRLIEQQGFTVRFDSGIFSKHTYLAGDDERRLNELLFALSEKDTHFIWAARGGYGATRLLPQLQIQKIRDANKMLIGFSDVTALHALWQQAGVLSLHAANVTTLHTWTEEAREKLFSNMLHHVSHTVFHGQTLMGKGRVEAPILGGNLMVMAAMAGTGFLPDFSNSIVLLEDVGEKPYRLDRALTQLMQTQAFGGVKGFALGQFTDCSDEAVPVVQSILEQLNVPIVGSLPFGHDKSAQSIVLGKHAILNATDGTLEQ